MKNYCKVSILSVICLILLSYGCEHQPKDLIKPDSNGKDTTNTGPTSNCDSSIAYFKNDILPIFTSNCVGSGCHNATDRAEGLVLTNYKNILKITDTQNPKGSELWKILVSTNSNKMMPRTQRLSANDRNKILKWMNQGAKNDTCNAGCDTTRFTYAEEIAPIITKNCMGCHSTGSTKIGTYNEIIVQVNNNNLWTDINTASGAKKMPPNFSLTVCDKKKIQKWIAAGAQDN